MTTKASLTPYRERFTCDEDCSKFETVDCEERRDSHMTPPRKRHKSSSSTQQRPLWTLVRSIQSALCNVVQAGASEDLILSADESSVIADEKDTCTSVTIRTLNSALMVIDTSSLHTHTRGVSEWLNEHTIETRTAVLVTRSGESSGRVASYMRVVVVRAGEGVLQRVHLHTGAPCNAWGSGSWNSGVAAQLEELLHDAVRSDVSISMPREEFLPTDGCGEVHHNDTPPHLYLDLQDVVSRETLHARLQAQEEQDMCTLDDVEGFDPLAMRLHRITRKLSYSDAQDLPVPLTNAWRAHLGLSSDTS